MKEGSWVIQGNRTTVESVEFSGARVPNRNGAGLRLEAAGLTLRYCFFHRNGDGILTDADAGSDIAIEHSEFADNGFGDGYSHNIYIGHVRSFTLRFSNIHHGVGHNVKRRALRNEIACNRIMDEWDGNSSYAIDLPDGGLAYVIGNVIQQGPSTENPVVISYGAEALHYPVNEFYISGNTLINDFLEGGRFVFVRDGTTTARLLNNFFVGEGEVLMGPGEARKNLRAAKSDFIDPVRFDYRLRKGSAGTGRGIDPGVANIVALRPLFEYCSFPGVRAKRESQVLDLGAYEFRDERDNHK